MCAVSSPWNWVALAILVIVIVSAAIVRLFGAQYQSRYVAKRLSPLGLREVGPSKYAGIWRGFHVSLEGVVRRGATVQVGSTTHTPTAGGYRVRVMLFDPISGGKLTPRQIDILADEQLGVPDPGDLHGIIGWVENDRLVYERVLEESIPLEKGVSDALDGGCAEARDLLLKMTGIDVWKDDPKMQRKREAAEVMAPWEKPV